MRRKPSFSWWSASEKERQLAKEQGSRVLSIYGQYAEALLLSMSHDTRSLELKSLYKLARDYIHLGCPEPGSESWPR